MAANTKLIFFSWQHLAEFKNYTYLKINFKTRIKIIFYTNMDQQYDLFLFPYLWTYKLVTGIQFLFLHIVIYSHYPLGALFYSPTVRKLKEEDISCSQSFCFNMKNKSINLFVTIRHCRILVRGGISQYYNDKLKLLYTLFFQSNSNQQLPCRNII